MHKYLLSIIYNTLFIIFRQKLITLIKLHLDNDRCSTEIKSFLNRDSKFIKLV